MEIKKTRQRNGIFESTPLTGLRAIRSLEATTTIRETEVILRIVVSKCDNLIAGRLYAISLMVWCIFFYGVVFLVRITSMGWVAYPRGRERAAAVRGPYTTSENFIKNSTPL